jgi:hypothetical protein
VIGGSVLLFDLIPDIKHDRVDRQQLATLGDVHTPSIADLFVAVIGNQAGQSQGQEQGKEKGAAK